MRQLFTAILLLFGFVSYSQDTLVFQIGNFKENVRLDKRISSDNYSYFICDSTNQLQITVPELNPVTDTLYDINGNTFTKHSDDSVFNVTGIIYRSEELLKVTFDLGPDSPLSYSAVYDVIQKNNREYGLQVSKLSKSEFEEFLNSLSDKYEGGFVKIYGINLYTDNKLIGGIGCGTIGILLFE